MWPRVVLSLSICLLPLGCGSVSDLGDEAAFRTTNPQPLRIGASAVRITPHMPLFLAGGFPYRLSLTVHDDLWARTIVLDDGVHRVALVALDLIGINYDDVLQIRSEIHEAVRVDYVLIGATHTHSAPDLVGLWAPTFLQHAGIYGAFLADRVVESVVRAIDDLRPATIRIASGPAGDPPLNHDTRSPDYRADTLTIWQGVDRDTGAVIATCVHYATHPILVPSYSLRISSDFVHYLRQALESGMLGDDGWVERQGGVAVYFNADMAGRLVPDSAEPLTVGNLEESGFQKAQAYGYRLAHRAARMLNDQGEWIRDPSALAVATRRVDIYVENDFLRHMVRARLIDRAIREDRITTEVGIIELGPVTMFAIPGMIFPELVWGNFSALPGSDFPDAPPESPVLSRLAKGRWFIPVGLANDMLGYIIPKALVDAAPPFTSEDGSAPYGEIVCPGSDTAATLLEAFARLNNRQ